jgi:protein sidekick
LGQFSKNYIFTKKIIKKLLKIWSWDLGSGIRDPGSGIRKKPIPDPGSRIPDPRVKKHPIPDPGSRIRIRNTECSDFTHFLQNFSKIINRVLQVWWLPPDPQKINGINQGYKLQAWRGDPRTPSIKPEKTVTVHPNVLSPLSEQTTLIEDLTPWTAYNVTVLCFTSAGDGVRSGSELVRTQQDFPGPVKGLKFEEITDRGVRVLWEEPEAANGIILGYSVRYMVKDMIHTLTEKNLTASELSFYLNQLKPTTHYTFEVYAWTEVGKGEASVATIQSGVEPVLPQPPTRLAVSNIEAFSAVVQFTPGFDGNSSITKWIVEASSARNATWHTVYEVADPDASTVMVKNLVPYMEYRLRLVANNVVGRSEPSEPTKKFQTIQARPKHAPKNVTIRAFEFTKLNVRWIPLSQQEWYGVPRGYNISYRIAGDSSALHSLSIEDPTANSFVLDKLEEFTPYEIVLQAYNDLGTSDPSPVVLERTNEATPGSGPYEVNATSTSSTTILVAWGDIEKIDRNGIIEGFKVYYGAKDVPFQYKNIKNNATRQTTLTELKKFTRYSIQVLAYTRIGDGALSSPPIQVTTFEDVPGPPSNISFPDVSYTTARIIWDVPGEPNGEIKAYRVNYHLLTEAADDSGNFTREFLPTDRTFRAVGLDPMSYYEFSVAAKTALGWGYTSKGVVYTTNNREAPQSPSAPQISPSQVQTREITFSWNPGSDGYAPLRYYSVQFSENSGPWQQVTDRVDPSLTAYTVYNLKPFMDYRFRIQAINDIGPSGWSEESNSTRTLPAAPSAIVDNLKVTPITRTDVRVTWDPLSVADFNGDVDTGGYIVEYREVTDFPSPLTSSPQVELKGISVSKVVLENLVKDKNYEITVVPFNSQGYGPSSRPIAVYVGEAVPTGAPQEIRAEATSPTEVRLTWRPPKADQQNGDLLGYKIFYAPVPGSSSSSSSSNKRMEDIEVISAVHNSHSLIFLDMYTNYTVSILAFNPAGEGPRSESVNIRTLQGIPGPPANLSFSEITMNTLKVSWSRPVKPNGEILGYVVSYETTTQNESKLSRLFFFIPVFM